MINTGNTKKEQLEKGFFTEGSGKEVVLIMGSCRSVPYMNYFKAFNANNRFTIHFIDPFNFNWNAKDDRVDYDEALANQETNKVLLKMLKSVDIFIHEYYQNAGMFNVFKDSDKNIYQFGMNAKIDLTIPNYNDVFLLTRDVINFDDGIRKLALQDYNVLGKLSDVALDIIKERREKNLEKFCDMCLKTSFPEFGKWFKDNYLNHRLFWTYNHVAKNFTNYIWFEMLLAMGLVMDQEVVDEIKNMPDMFANNYTYLSEYDTEFKWDEEVKPLKETLF